MKIFKYPISNHIIEAPINRTTIRIDHVDDGFYPKGDYLWAIVDPDDEKVVQKLSPDEQVQFAIRDGDPDVGHLEEIELRVKEKQEIFSGLPVYAQEDDGKMYVYCLKEEPRIHKICVYKTGQEMDIDPAELKYIGFNRLWIIQELCLYVFRHEPLQ
jgi:hypothetical protein